LADGGRVAHVQPRFARGAGDSKKFHAACQRFSACAPAREESFQNRLLVGL
jgi:hypothetical protein